MPLLTLAWWWWADARVRALPGGRWWRGVVAAYALAFVVGLAGFFMVRFNGWSVGPPSWWTAGLMLWGMIVLPGVAVPLMAATAAWRVAASIGRIRRGGVAEAATGPTRREVLGAAVALAPMVLALGATGVSIPQKRRFRVRHIDVDIPGLPPALDGMTIAHLSDTHVGKFTRGDVLDRIASQTNRLDADLVLFTGDLIDFSLRDVPEAVAMLKRIDRSDRLFVVEGNHDLFEGREAFEQSLRAAGLPLLLDEAATVAVRGEPVQILGIRWHYRGSGMGVDHHVRQVAALRDRDAFPILLAHHPHAFDAAVDHGIPLTLAGHTHGGQLMLSPEFGAGPMMFRYWSGLYRQRGARLVVSNGVGNWFPLRTHAPAEIVHLSLRRV